MRCRAAFAIALASFVLAFPVPAFGSALFVISGDGFGNDVGMSQWGAEGYALHHWGYRRILAHYYPHTAIAVAPERTVRVLLANGQKQAAISSAAPFLLVDARGRKVHLRAGRLVLTPRLRLGRNALVPPIAVEPGAQPLSLDGKGYRGSLTIRRTAGTLAIVNTVPLERYLRGVVPSEMPTSWGAAAYKAQAVAARSYALAELKPGTPFDLYADNRSQVYGGIAAEERATDLAVGATAGQVLTYANQVIAAYYDSSSGGRTAAVEDVFAGSRPEPYLVSVSDPYDGLAPFHRWRVVLGAQSLSARLGMTIDDVRVEHIGPDVADRVLLLAGPTQKAVTGKEFSQALGLRSPRFSVGVASLAQAPARVPVARPLRLHGFLRQIGDVVLEQRLQNGTWRPLSRVRARPDGRFAVVVRPLFSTAYRLEAGRIPGPTLTITVSRRPASRSVNEIFTPPPRPISK